MAQGNAHRDQKRTVAQAKLILNRFRKESLKIYKDEQGNELPISTNQIKCGEIVLRKSVPDLKAIEHTGGDGGPLQISVVQFANTDTE